MKLTIDKLQLFMRPYGFSIRKIYTGIKQDIYIECYSRITMISILIKVSRKYEVVVDNSIQLTEFKRETKSSESLVSELYSLPSSECTTQPDQLYQFPIINIEDEESNAQHKCASVLLSQTHRLKHCVKHISYNLALTSKYNMICVMHSQHTLSLYQNNTTQFSQPMYLIVDFSDFYSRRQHISSDVEKIMSSIEHLLETNESSHITNINNMMHDEYSFMDTYQTVEGILREYKQYVDKYKLLVNEIDQKKEEKQRELRALSVASPAQLHKSIKVTHEKQSIEKEVKELEKSRKKTEDLLFKIQSEKTALLLKVDNLLYCSAVLFTELSSQIKNFSILLAEK